MSRRLRRSLALFIVLLGTRAVAAPREDPTEHLNTERDALLDKIAKGVDVEASTHRFAALLKQRDAVVPTTKAAMDVAEAARKKESDRHSAARDWEHKFRESADYRIRLVCELTPDPSHPPEKRTHIGDWGRLTRKQTFERNPADDDRPADMGELFEVKGVAGTYVFDGGERTRGHSSGDFHRFKGNVGDLVFVCPHEVFTERWRQMPAGWSGTYVHSGFAIRLERPPVIADKKKFAPVYRQMSAFSLYTVKDEWRWPAGQNSFSLIEVGRDVGNGRIQIEDQGHVWQLEVPQKLAHRDLLVEGHSVWMVLGTPRFEPAPPDGKAHGLKPPQRMVVPVLDIEAMYLFEKP